jgi:hypothetical protein
MMNTRSRRLALCLLAVAVMVFVYGSQADPTAAISQPAPDPPVAGEPAAPPDLSKFKHGNPAHTRLPCLICHRRDDNSPRIKFPGANGHLPCASCHTAEFAGNTSPMCTICHTATGMKRFPPLRSFTARFDHGRHQRVNCATCHKPSGRGSVSFSIPAGGNAHATCFSCHTNKASNKMASSST